MRELHSRGELELKDVEFRYPGAAAPVLQNISFRATAGQTTAIIGSTGAGKSTLISLVARLFDATAGSVLIDGVSVRDLDPEMLWSRIGLVPQKPYLFTGTVASNLRYGNPEATDARLRAALRPLTAQATVVIVSQRVSTITDADQIIVLDDGAIVGLGRHKQLLVTCPTYVEIVQSQLAAEPAA